MNIFPVIATLAFILFVSVVILLRRAPAGYEDESGWHEESEKK